MALYITESNYKCYYFGEMGYLLVAIIPLLHEIFAFYPQVTFTISTTPNYFSLLSHIFDNKIIEDHTVFTLTRSSTISNIDINYKNSINLFDLVKKINPHIVTQCSHGLKMFDGLIFKEIESNMLPPDQKYITIFPRNRTIDPLRNMSHVLFNYYVKKIQEQTNLPIVVIGHPEETLDVDISIIPNAIRVTNFIDYIHYLKHSALFITSDSGIKDLAIMCNCPHILMHTARDAGNGVDPYHYYFNPLYSKLMIVRSKEFSSLHNETTEFIKSALKREQNLAYHLQTITNTAYIPTVFLKSIFIKDFPRYFGGIRFVSNLKGVSRIDYAIIDEDANILRHLKQLCTKKISIFYKNTIDPCALLQGEKYTIQSHTKVNDVFNIVLENNDHWDSVSYIIQGRVDNFVKIVQNYYILFGRVIRSVWTDHNFTKIENIVATENYYNGANIYYQIYTTVMGLYKCVTPYAIKVRSDEYYSDQRPIINKMINSSKLLSIDIFFRKTIHYKYHISDHLIACRTPILRGMFNTAFTLSNNYYNFNEEHKPIISKFYGTPHLAPEQLLTICYFLYLGVPLKESDAECSELMKQYVDIIPVKNLGRYGICSSVGKLVRNTDIYAINKLYAISEFTDMKSI